ncbi:hypothetical protein HMPREF9695_04432 [Afipia broomeae ATCC 49717]|uniref:Uncharacterized protein n=1 Tax=Afipia broomeae ATCC 49717 TaxID=883078 RepID=K8NW07_9BRAD|nr:hypothetical protein HMPREF9695_04432 [Afipia broomeae ATCC 49717]
MTPTSLDATPLVSRVAIARASRAVVANAMAGDFPVDPVIGPDWSKTFSIINSVVTRHGLLLQRTLADSLAASGRFEVLTEVPLPVTEAANDLLTSKNSARDLAKIRLQADSKISRMVKIDLIVVDTESGWAGAYDVKRGNAATRSGKRHPIEHGLLAARLVLASFLAKCGYEGIRSVTTAVIDYYGASGFSKELKLTRDELDGHFGVPVVATVDSMTVELQRALHSEMRNLLVPAMVNLPHEAEQVISDIVVPGPAAETLHAELRENTLGRVLNARPTGPGPWRARMT